MIVVACCVFVEPLVVCFVTSVGSAGASLSWEYGEGWRLYTWRVWQPDCWWPKIRVSAGFLPCFFHLYFDVHCYVQKYMPNIHNISHNSVTCILHYLSLIYALCIQFLLIVFCIVIFFLLILTLEVHVSEHLRVGDCNFQRSFDNY